MAPTVSPLAQLQIYVSNTFTNRKLEIFFIPVVIAILSSIFLLALRSYILKKFTLKAQREGSLYLNLGISAFKGLSFFWCFVGGIYVGISASEIPRTFAKPMVEVMNALLIFSLAYVSSQLVAQIFLSRLDKRDDATPTSNLVLMMLRAIIMVPGILLVLSVLGISVTPVLTALGVGGIAVALALKDSLENLFSGVYLLFDRAVRVGDPIRLESGQEGIVRDISWRTTRIQTSENSIILVPNSKLAQSMVTNLHYPNEFINLSISIPLAYGNDLSRIEQIILEPLIRNEPKIEGLLLDPAPIFRFNPGFLPTHLEFTLTVGVQDYAHLSLARHELRKRIYEWLKTEHLTFPECTFIQRKDT